MARIFSFFLMICLLVSPGTNTFAQSTENIDKAILLIKTLCISTGKKLEIEAKGKAGITIRQLQNSGVQGEVHISSQEFEGFAEALHALSESQASQARECMKPHIKRLLDALLGPQADNTPLTPTQQKIIRDKITQKYSHLAKVFIRHTHPTGKFLETFPPTVQKSDSGKNIESQLSVRWKGGFLGNIYLTSFSINIDKSGVKDVKVVSDTAIFKIAPDNFRAAVVEIKSILND